jgi:hypothetical protein
MDGRSTEASKQTGADRWPRWPLLWVAAAMLIATFLQCDGLCTPLSLDEILTKWIASAPTAAGVVERSTHSHALGPLHYLLVHESLTVVPNETLAMRLPSVIFGIASVGLFYLVGKALVDRSFGAFACLAAALEATTVYVGRSARPYSLALMAALLAVWGFLRWRDGGRRAWLLVYAAGMALVLHANYVFGLLVFPLGLFVLMKGAPPKPRLRALIEFGCASAIAGAALIPLLPNLRFAMKNAGVLQSWPAADYSPNFSMPPILYRLALFSFVACGAALGLTALFASKPFRASTWGDGGRRVREAALLGILWYGVPAMGLVALNVVFGLRIWTDRYFTVYLGGPLVLAALPTVLAGRRTRVPLLYGTVLLLLLASDRLADLQRYGTWGPSTNWWNMEAMVDEALDGADSHDVVLCQCPYTEGNLLTTGKSARGDGLLVDYLLSPVRVYAPEGASAEVLPLPYSNQVAPFEQYYDEVVGPAISRARTVILVSWGVESRFEEWLLRRDDEGDRTVGLGPWRCVSSRQFTNVMGVRRYSRQTPRDVAAVGVAASGGYGLP